MNHIAICVPVVDIRVRLEFAASLCATHYQLGRFGWPVAIIHEGGSIISRVRNRCLEHVEKFEAEGKIFDWIYFVDSDMRFPPETLLKLLQHYVQDEQKLIIGCTYRKRSPPYDIHGKGLEGVPHDIEGQGLLEVAALPTGMLLIHRSVFRTLKRPYFRLPYREESAIDARDHQEFGEDYYFCSAARAAGHRVWLDTELTREIGHISEKVLYPDKEPWAMTVADAETPEGIQQQILALQERQAELRRGANGR